MSAPRAGPGTAGAEAAAGVVRSGGVLLYPTETVYGLGGDPAVPEVYTRVRALKGRSVRQPFLVLTDRWERVMGWLAAVSAPHQRLMTHEPPLPVTVLFRAGASAPPPLVGPEGLVGVRRTADRFCRAVIEGADRPLVSTSANLSGGAPPRRFEDVDVRLREGVDLAVDAGAPLAGVPSTVVRFDDSEDGRLVVVREGAVSAEALRQIVG